MNYFYAILLGIVQGLTEFLPVSSSAHLVFFQTILPGFTQPGVLFDVFLHMGTLVAVCFYFYKEILKINVKYLYLIVIGTIPAVFIGFLLRNNIEILYTGTKIVGVELMIAGVLNIAVDRFRTSKKEISRYDSLLIGIAQAVAIIPGISRSGATIFTGVARKIKRGQVAKFSFILSIPAILGANILEFATYYGDPRIDYGYYLVGFIAAAISGFFAIRLTINLLKVKNFKYFGIYCLVMGFLMILLL